MLRVPWEPRRDIDRFLDDWFWPLWPRTSTDLAADVYEIDDTTVATLSVAGVTPQELTVTVEGTTLIVSGRRAEEVTSEDKDYYNKEIRRGSFMRSLQLPRSVDASQATAHYDNGMLTVTLPATPDGKNVPVVIPVT